jgi:hypothetical protein
MRLDRNAFPIQSFREAEQTREFWLKKSPAERWAAAWYLTCCAWNIDHKNPPRLDRTVFSMRKNG